MLSPLPEVNVRRVTCRGVSCQEENSPRHVFLSSALERDLVHKFCGQSEVAEMVPEFAAREGLAAPPHALRHDGFDGFSRVHCHSPFALAMAARASDTKFIAP